MIRRTTFRGFRGSARRRPLSCWRSTARWKASLPTCTRSRARNGARASNRSKDLALISRRLVRLVDDVPLDIDWHAAHVGGMDVQAVLDLCAEFGFQSLPKRLTGLMVSAAPASWSTRLRDDCHAGGPGGAGVHAEPAGPHCGRHRDHFHARAVGPAGGLLVRVAGRACRLRAAASTCGRAAPRSVDDARRAATDPGKPADRQGRTESEIRPDRVAQCRHPHAGHGVRHDGRRLPAGPGGTQPQHGRSGETVLELRHDQDPRS